MRNTFDHFYLYIVSNVVLIVMHFAVRIIVSIVVSTVVSIVGSIVVRIVMNIQWLSHFVFCCCTILTMLEGEQR